VPRRPKPPTVRGDGRSQPGNLAPPGAGQPNGRGLSPDAVPTGLPYGEGGALRAALGGTPQPPAPPGISPQAHAAHMALRGYRPNVTPLSAPTERPWEPVTAGAPLDAGPTHPMAQAGMQQPIGGANVTAMLQAAAAASGSPTLTALAQQMGAQSSMPAPPATPPTGV
jgi:hypothetical protein